MAVDLKRLRTLSGQVAVVGVGETDFAADFAAQRGLAPAGYVPLDNAGLASLAFERALKESGLARRDIDGLGVCAPFLNHEAMGEHLGLDVTYQDGGMSFEMMPRAVAAIASGQCDTIALLFGLAQRSGGAQYGGSSIRSGPPAYYYYHPWGWSGQPAHWALMFNAYQLRYGGTEEQLGAVATTFRRHAMLTPNAVMRTPMTIEDYLACRYIVRPLRLFDLCVVHDGGVCIILQRAAMAKDRPHTPVLVDGVGVRAGGRDNSQLRGLVDGHLREYLKTSGDMCFGMAGLQPKDIDTMQVYDSGSPHVPIQLEGFGFCKPGEGLDFIQDGRIGLGGELPMNTSGGQLSGSYTMGFSQMVECVQQLRGEAGERQVQDARTALFCQCSGIGSFPIIFRRGD